MGWFPWPFLFMHKYLYSGLHLLHVSSFWRCFFLILPAVPVCFLWRLVAWSYTSIK